MKYVTPTLAALLIAGTAFAQTAPKPPKPAQSVLPALPAVPAVPASPASAAQRAPTADEELALTALEGLMAQSPERALPILKRVLAGSQTTLVKQRALFVLSQIDSPEAREILAQQSRSADPAMRSEAIRSIGIDGDPKSLAALKQVYDTGSQDVKAEVLQAWMIAGYKDGVYQAALSAKTEEEATQAIHMLAVMGATEELRKLVDKPNAARGLLDALAMSGDLAGLRKIVDGTGEKSIRLDAVRRIGMIDADESGPALRDIYTRSTDAEFKEAALQGLLMSGDEKNVLALYRAAKSSDEKRNLLRTLTMMDGDAALEAIDATLDGKAPAAAPVTPPTTNALFEKKFQQEAKNYEKYQHEGQVVYCKKEKVTMSNIPSTRCITEAQLRQQVEDYQRNRNSVTRPGLPATGTVPGG